MGRQSISPSDNNHLIVQLSKNSEKNRYKFDKTYYNNYDIVDYVVNDIEPPFVMPLNRGSHGFSRKIYWDGEERSGDHESQLRFHPDFIEKSRCIKLCNGWRDQCKFRFTDKELNIIGNSIKKYFKEKYDIDLVVKITTWKNFE